MADLGGLTPQHAAAGFGGALAYLPFSKPANKLAILGSVTCGVVTAMFLTPFVAQVMSHQALLGSALTPRAELGLAFLLGLTAMILIPACLAAATWLRDNIGVVMRRITGTQGGGDGA
jgi:hypothetical protein